MREITARKQKRNPDALQEYKESYHTLTELLPLGAFHLGPGPDYSFLFANQMLARMLGYDSADAIIGISARNIINNPIHWQQIEKDLKTDKTVSGRELQLRQKEGSEILVSLNARAIPGSGLQIAGIEAIAEDITEQKVLEMEMQYYNSELKRYASSLTQVNKKLNVMNQITRHDILNTITGLFGYVDMAKATNSPEEKRGTAQWYPEPYPDYAAPNRVYQGVPGGRCESAAMAECEKINRNSNCILFPTLRNICDRYRKSHYLCRPSARESIL